MMRHSVQPRDYGFLSFAKNMGNNICKNISKSLSGNYSPGMLAVRQKLLDHAKNLQQMCLKLLQKESFKKH